MSEAAARRRLQPTWEERTGVTTCSSCFLLAAKWFTDGRRDLCFTCAIEELGGALAG